MLRTVIWIAVVCIGVSAFVAAGIRDDTFRASPASHAQGKPTIFAKRASPQPRARRRPAEAGNGLVIEAGAGGHYVVDATVNGSPMRFLVDTGASTVALSQADAERAGFAVHQLDYSARAKTANGIARVARVVIDEIALGDIRMTDVEAAVVDAPMEVSLLGMSFLGRLPGFEVEESRLILRW